MTTNPPKVPGICDLDGTPLVTREDDRESVIRERLREYDSRTLPILKFFREAGVQMLDIKAAEATPEQIMQEIWRGLTEAGLIVRAAAEIGVAPSGLK